MGKHEFGSQIDKAITAVAHQEFMTLYWPDGSVSRFHYQWLRDNCRSTERFDPVTKERKALTESIPSKLIASEIAITGAEIRIKWSDESVDSRFDAHWLKRNSYDMAEISTKAPKQFWGSEYGSSLESFTYDEVMSDDNASAAMIAAFEAFGLVRLTDMPTTDREVERFANRLSYVREIAFDRVADIRVSMDPYTLGVTNAALPLHTDCFGYSCPPMSWHSTVCTTTSQEEPRYMWTAQTLWHSCAKRTPRRFRL